MITMLYEKTLSRKIIVTPPEAEKSTDGDAQPNGQDSQNGNINTSKTSRNSFASMFVFVREWFHSSKRWFKSVFGSSDADTEAKKPASMGKILNLMRNDVYEVSQRFWEVDQLAFVPLGIVWSVVLVCRMIGPSSLLGALTVIAAQIITAIVVKIMLRYERRRRKATDARLQATSQTIESIRHLRWYGWQQTWIDRIMGERQKELNLKITTNAWGLVLGLTNTFAAGAFPVAAFAAYTAIEGKPLRLEIAFPALQLFMLMGFYLRALPGLITTWLNAMVAIGRIEDFMKEEDKGNEKDMPSDSGELSFKGASLAWPGTSDPTLRNLDVGFGYGLTVICGQVGSGKTALLQGLLGELDLLEGHLQRPAEIYAYCNQTPWLESMSIRENILFAAPHEDARYREVLDACALNPDLASFKNGDLSKIGENGIGLSGGQKARVSLARAFYSRASTLLLDDPISALDHNTAESIIRKSFSGPLLEGRRITLVTHRPELCIDHAVKILEVSDNTVRQISQEEARAKGISSSTSAAQKNEEDDQEDTKTKEEQEAAAVPDEFIEEEHRASGGVKRWIYWQYVKAGKLKWWLLLAIVMGLFRVGEVARTWLLKEWGEAYDQPTISAQRFFDGLPNPEVNIHPWLWALLGLVVFYCVMFALSRIIMIVIVYTTGRRMFKAAIDRVTHATFRFYDVTPIGRLMNRLTSDIGTVDGSIAEQLNQFAYQGIAWVTALVIIASVTPSFLFFTVVVTASFIMIFRQFLPASQNLRRLEMVSLSPLMSNFGALLEGLMTVRAYGAQGRFQARNITVVDTFQRMDHFYWIVQEWLMFRFEALSAFSTFVLTLLALFTNVTAGLAAFVLQAANHFVSCTHMMCRQYGQIEMDFTSVERVVELLHLDQEPKGDIQPPAVWPSTSGDIVFENVTIKYAPHLEPALIDASFTIKGGSNAAIVGRTGSGKSTLAISLLATILPTNGRIIVDGIDISKVDPQVLRQRVTFLAQDPLLFEGTIRENLDPLKESTDEECSAALDRVCDSNSQGHDIAVAGSSTQAATTSQHQSTWTLSTRIESGGKNFSQGQRQLVGLARAVLRRSSIIILDEATASIDLETSMRIQQVLREEMQQSTVLTIAHRVEAVRDAEVAVVLSKRRLQEFRVERPTEGGSSESSSSRGQ